MVALTLNAADRQALFDLFYNAPVRAPAVEDARASVEKPVSRQAALVNDSSGKRRLVHGTGEDKTWKQLADEVAAENIGIEDLTGTPIAKFGAVGDGVTDDTAAFLQAVDEARIVDLDPTKTYKISNIITMTADNRTVRGNGAKIIQTGVQKQIFDVTGRDNITFDGIHFYGRGQADFTNGSTRADGIYGLGASRIKVLGCTFENFGHAAMTLTASTMIIFSGNICTGLDAPALTPVTSGANYGVIFDAGCSRIICTANQFSKGAQGITTGDGTVNCIIAQNHIFDVVGQHGMYCGGGQRNLLIAENNVVNPRLIGIKVQNYDTPALFTDNVLVLCNNIDGTGVGGDGISVVNVVGFTKMSRNVKVHGNEIRNCGQDAISMTYVEDGDCSGNRIYGSARDGIAYGGCKRVKIVDNDVRDTVGPGVRDYVAASSEMRIARNNLFNCTSQASGERYCMFIQITTNSIIEFNWITGHANAIYALFLATNQLTNRVRGNIGKVTNASSVGARFESSSVSLAYCGDNDWSGALGSVQAEPSVQTRGNRGNEYFSATAPADSSLPVGSIVWNTAPGSAGTAAFWMINDGGTAVKVPVAAI